MSSLKDGEIPGSRKSYCRECKRMTETVLLAAPGMISFLLRERIRVCRVCGKSKPASSIEMEKTER